MNKRPRKYRTYTDQERMVGLAVLAARGGNVEKTAKLLDMPAKTLEQWKKGARHAEAAAQAEAVKPLLRDVLEERIRTITGGMTTDKIAESKLKDQADAAGQLFEMMQLLDEKPTGITRTEGGEPDLSNATDDEIRNRIAALEAGTTPAGTDGGAPQASGNGTAPKAPRGS